MVNRERLVKEFLELTSIDSLSKKERKMADALKARLEAMGYEVYEDDAGKKIGGEAGNIICTVKGTKDVPAVMLRRTWTPSNPASAKRLSLTAI